MSYLSARRMLSACAVSAAAVAALATAGTASATTLTNQCGGSNIKGLGSTFQAPAQEPVWNPDFNKTATPADTNLLACAGQAGQGTGTGVGLKPTVTYESTGSNAGSGACLKDFGDGATAKYGFEAGEDYPFCGTDEAPSESALEKIEESGGKTGAARDKSVESLPVLQGAVAVIVHLPGICKASDVVTKGATHYKQGRLALDDATILGIYRGEIKNWKEVIAAQGTDGEDHLEGCTTAEEETPIKVVVRTDKSGTTHIFKSYLALVEEALGRPEFEAEEFAKIEEENKLEENACNATLPAKQLRTFKDVQEGCENQRWPEAAHIVRPEAPGKKGYKGNPGVVYEVTENPSSIGYADLSVAREKKAFSANCTGAKKHPANECGGENKKGSETVKGEKNSRFWAEVQNDNPGEAPTYSDPATNGDIEKAASSNCASTDYIGKVGETIPPVNTRIPWNTTKAALKEKGYAICGLTYDLALREYQPYLEHKQGHALSTAEEEKGIAEAQTARDYLLWELNTKTDGGGKYIVNHDYAPLAGKTLKEAEAGAAEITWP
jgi:ABC-type phosphate transport system substrate-binding protein